MSESPFNNPKKYFQDYWMTMTKEERLSLYKSMDYELNAPVGSLIDRTFYTPPLSVSIHWMKELVDKDNAQNS